MARIRGIVGGAARLGLLAVMLVGLAARPTPAVPPPDGPSHEYTVASGEVPASVSGQVGLPGQIDPLRPVRDTLALVMVGGLLLGLAAAVRRTT